MTAARRGETEESDEAHGHGWIITARLAPRQQIHSAPFQVTAISTGAWPFPCISASGPEPGMELFEFVHPE